MRLALLSLSLVTVHVSVTVDCRPPRHRPTGGVRTAAGAHAGPFYSEQNKLIWKLVHRGLLAVFPRRKTTNDFVSILDLRKGGFLCVDVNGKLYKSRPKDSWDSLFQPVWLQLGTHDEFDSTRGNRRIRLGGGGLWVARRGPLEQLQHPVVKRQRRSEEVNPADPLRSESHPLKPVNPGQPDQEQAGVVSKETISSCDDPLRVLQPNGHGSPVKTNIADRAGHQ